MTRYALFPLFFLLACGTTEETAEEEPEEEVEPEPKKPKKPVSEKKRNTTFAREGWIGEGRPTLNAKKKVDVELMKLPAGKKQDGSCTIEKGAELKWNKSVIATNTSGEVSLKREVTIDQGNSRIFGDVTLLRSNTPVSKQESIVLKKGSKVELLQSWAEGVSLYRIGTNVFETAILGGKNVATVAQKPDTGWWVLVACEDARGWVHVDKVKDEFIEDRQM